MDGDPLITGADAIYPSQNSSAAPTTWEEDLERATREGLPSGPGAMLRLVKRTTDRQFLPGGEVNPSAETAPIVVQAQSFRTTPGQPAQRLSEARICSGSDGGAFSGGAPGTAGAPDVRGAGVIGLGAPGDGVRGFASGPVPDGYGVLGRTDSASPLRAGVLGAAGRGGVGVRGESFTGSGIGVDGHGSRVGVRGVGSDEDNPEVSGIGVEGIPGPLVGGIVPFAGAFRGAVLIEGNTSMERDAFVRGDLTVLGFKSAAVRLPDGSYRALYAVESPENWFEDFGRAELVRGQARVEFPADFADLARPSDDYHVFLTAEGDTQGLFVAARTESGFEVREQQGGNNSLSFSYRIVVRRPDIEPRRLAPVDIPSPDAGEPAAVPAWSADTAPQDDSSSAGWSTGSPADLGE
jgi:hypothetical protein